MDLFGDDMAASISPNRCNYQESGDIEQAVFLDLVVHAFQL